VREHAARGGAHWCFVMEEVAHNTGDSTVTITTGTGKRAPSAGDAGAPCRHFILAGIGHCLIGNGTGLSRDGTQGCKEGESGRLWWGPGTICGSDEMASNKGASDDALCQRVMRKGKYSRAFPWSCT
jgi:hypothetical protein